MNIINWIEDNLAPRMCTSEKFIYNDMESQSGYSLPIIYEPFDGTNKWHWLDRGSLFDYLYSIDGGGKTLLDFGPGDGWPSLIIAPYARKVIGLDSSQRRVEVCTKNAERLGIKNAKFVNYITGQSIPFEDNTFDGIMAASSVEQTPNPKETLSELYRVLKPGGRLRISYEAMSEYSNGEEQDIWIEDIGEDFTKIIIYDRKIDNECAIQHGITVQMQKKEVIELLSKDGSEVAFDKLTVEFLEEIKNKITNAQVCKLNHPSGKTLVGWLKEIGFKEVMPSHRGSLAAVKLYEQYSDKERPRSLEEVDEAIKKSVKVIVGLRAPIDMEPMITAIK